MLAFWWGERWRLSCKSPAKRPRKTCGKLESFWHFFKDRYDRNWGGQCWANPATARCNRKPSFLVKGWELLTSPTSKNKCQKMWGAVLGTFVIVPHSKGMFYENCHMLHVLLMTWVWMVLAAGPHLIFFSHLLHYFPLSVIAVFYSVQLYCH